ncbi:helix-turn-helix domain-containing protein [Natrarchaeobaculum aegyptiacum]|uniref:Bacterio-opsin activator n=1 Tax=Natrarchaeobaculum aegyptiacum TaxID=745377 RepID=A0A2Z2HTK2_9EURY|nr:helix-turn-helix domain-containing protein [Natrarchaeobaculum aegyptiacum]ARS90566.1 bacterio-opsin activator [Natrarchaeobaculum aegyptiacum]
MTGFRATVVVDEPTGCPVASVSETTDEPIDGVNRTRSRTDGGMVVEEFSADASADVDRCDIERPDDLEFTPMQSFDSETVYRFERDADDNCACEVVEDLGTPITSVRAQGGSLLLSFHTADLEAISEIVAALRDRFDGVVVEELGQSADDSSDPVVVDRDVLTDRQREIVETAHELGYFSYPKGANATDVAEELGIARSTFTEHLAAAQTKLMDAVLES